MMKVPAAATAVAASSSDAGAADPSRGTSQRRPDIVDQIVRKSCSNALVVAAYLLNAPLSYRRLAIFVECSTAVEKWHGDQAKEVKNCESAERWLIDQTGGDRCMRHITCCWVPLSMAASVARQGFWTPHGGQPMPDEAGIMAEDTLATEAGRFVLALIRRRLVRTMHITVGWPLSAARLLHSPRAADVEMQRFKSEADNHKRLEASTVVCDVVGELVRRSIVQRSCMKQFVLACEESNFTLTPAIGHHLHQHFRQVGSTQVVEDGFNHMKSDKVTLKRKRQAAPERAMAVVVHKNVLGGRHDFKDNRPHTVA